jgi:LCP family protein required for cell wall assembly
MHDVATMASPAASPAPIVVRILRWFAVGLAGVLVVGVTGVYLIDRHLNGNIGHIAGPTGLVPQIPHRPHDKTLNYLIIGSDNRQIPGGRKYGHGDFENLSDTVILAHIPGNGRSAQMISFPRDGLVTIPSCSRKDGTVVPAHQDKFNAAFAIGGPACTIKAVEALSHIPINDYIIVSLPGFVQISNALGGVEVCLPQAVDDPKAKLHLPAGRQKIKGETALAFVREREQLGGSRIRRQQEFLASAIKEATISRLLFHPFRLYHLLDAATKAITTGHLGLGDLRRLANRFRSIKPGRITFYTVPTFPETRQVLAGYDNPAGVFVDPIDTVTADRLFESIRHDTAVAVPTPSASGSASPLPSLIVDPANVPVRVLNGNGVKGAAGRAAADLRAAGFDVVDVGDADSDTYTQTVVRYGATRVQSSQTLAAAVPGAVREYDAGLGNIVDIVIGSDYTGAHTVTVSPGPSATPSTTPEPIPSFKATDDPCSANSLENGPA